MTCTFVSLQSLDLHLATASANRSNRAGNPSEARNFHPGDIAARQNAWGFLATCQLFESGGQVNRISDGGKIETFVPGPNVSGDRFPDIQTDTECEGGAPSAKRS